MIRSPRFLSLISIYPALFLVAPLDGEEPPDTTPPIIWMDGHQCQGKPPPPPPVKVLECVDRDGTPFDVGGIARDDQDESTQAFCGPVPFPTFPLGATEVLCIAVDSSGNETQCKIIVLVVDTQGPEVTCPPAVEVECSGPDGTPVDYSHLVFARDVCTPWHVMELVFDPPSRSLFDLGEHTVRFTAIDRSGNQGVCEFPVIVVDTAPPNISTPEEVVAYTADPSGTKVGYDVSAWDACSGPCGVGCTPPSGSHFAIGTHTVRCVATDASGNVSERSFTVRVEFGEFFRRGDSNGDGWIDIADAVNTVLYLFVGEGRMLPCPEAADANDDGWVNIADCIFTVNYLFLGGPEPPPPGPELCGPDGAGSPSLGCDVYPSC